MPLTLLTGPAGSGKTGEVLERFAAALDREPVLVVPTRADVERFEDELLARRPVALGGRVITFERLFELAAAAAGLVDRPGLGPAQRRAVIASVVAEAKLRVLAGPALRHGFVDALDRFLGELQAALISPGALARRLTGTARSASRADHHDELAHLYGAYRERRDALGRGDAHSLAEQAVRAIERRPEAWGGRPLLVTGFDDLTPAQLTLVAAIAGGGAEVVVSVVHEPGRACLAARRRLVERLEGCRPGAAAPERIDLEPRAGTSTLAHLERAFLDDAPERREPDGGLRLHSAAGVRAEVEQVAAAVARLLRSGTVPAEVAVISRSPQSSARLVEEVFDGYGVPVAVRAERPIAETAAGGAFLAVLRAALGEGAAGDVVAFLRSPSRAPERLVDRLEQAVRTRGLESVEEALAAWEELAGWRPDEVDRLRVAAEKPGPALLEQCARVARGLFERPHLRAAPLPGPAERGDLLASQSLAATLAELAELAHADARLAPSPRTLVRLLERVRAPRSSAAAGGRVELLGPYGARARQFSHVFVLSLQEGEFPRGRREDPFLSEEERARAGLPQRADVRDEERYLFYVCLTRATRRLSLSYRSTDDEGAAATRSFFVDEVLGLLAPGAEEQITTVRSLGATVLEPQEAPTADELARSLAVRGFRSPPAELGAASELNRRLEQRLATAHERACRRPGRIRTPFVLERHAEKHLIGASSLETYATCAFRWFVDHELAPVELAPPPEPLARGGMTHAVLERLYEERGRPDSDTLDGAIERAGELLAETVSGTTLDPRRAAARPLVRRMRSDLARFLRYDAAHAADGEVAELEASFGRRDDDEREPLALDGFELHGRIDRIDRVGGDRALIRDYKTGASVASRKRIAEEKQLQLPLYMLAARRLWGLDPVGAVYHPLGQQGEHEPRGILRGPRKEWELEESFKGTDHLPEDEFEQTLADAQREAESLARGIHAGFLARNPLGGSCPRHCDFHAICRRERGEKNPEENGWAEDDDDE